MALPRVAKINGFVDVEGDPVAYVSVDSRDYLLRSELVNALDVPNSWVEPRALTVFVKINSWEKRQLIPRDHLDAILSHVADMRRLDDLRAGIDSDSDDFIVPDDHVDVRDDVSSEQEHEGYADDESVESSDRPRKYFHDSVLPLDPEDVIIDDPQPRTSPLPRVITDDEEATGDSVVTDDPLRTSSLQPAKKRRVLLADD